MTPPPSIAARIADARARIAAAETAAGRPAGSVTLTVVSKTQPHEAVSGAIAAGADVFGENRVQEAQARWAELPRPAELRLIGALQSNKVAAACDLFDVVETLDRDSLLTALAARAQTRGRAPRLLIQVNTGEEPQKAGVVPAAADALIARARAADLPVEGLMCIPPADVAPGPHFALLADIAARNGLATLSMGMSDDFGTAIRHGATHVRLGSALFGPRPTRAG
jgi:pyridoxal phosphate enzyme (YggS family)